MQFFTTFALAGWLTGSFALPTPQSLINIVGDSLAFFDINDNPLGDPVDLINDSASIPSGAAIIFTDADLSSCSFGDQEANTLKDGATKLTDTIWQIPGNGQAVRMFCLSA